jgi:hypothetical protein
MGVDQMETANPSVVMPAEERVKKSPMRQQNAPLPRCAAMGEGRVGARPAP